MVVWGDEQACPEIEEPKKKLGREFPHGQTALAVPSNNQKTIRCFCKTFLFAVVFSTNQTNTDI